MGLRGTEVATYDFAHYNEEILGNESVIVIPQGAGDAITEKGRALFADRFQILEYPGINNLDNFLVQNRVDAVYNHEVYADATWTCPSCKTRPRFKIPSP